MFQVVDLIDLKFLNYDCILTKKGYIFIVDTIRIKPYRTVKFKMNSEFLNLVVKDTLKVVISPYNCKHTYYLQYYIQNDYLYIRTNAKDYTLRNKYCTLNIFLIGERKDKQVLNELKEIVGG